MNNGSESQLSSAAISPFESKIVKLSSLQKFVDECGGISVLDGLTVTDVFDFYWNKRIFAEVGSANIFVSFSWQHKFLEILVALKIIFLDSPDLFIWMDFFSMGRYQHIKWENLVSANDFHHIVLMLTPWNSSAPRKRIVCNSECKCTFDIAMSPADEEELKYAINEDCNYAKHLAILSAEKLQLPKVNIESISNIPFDTMDANTFSSLVKMLGDGFEICCAIIRLNNITGSLFESISNEDELIMTLQKSGIRSSFHQKVIARNILTWKNQVATKAISDVYRINPVTDVTILSTIEYSNTTFQYPVDGIKLSSLNKFIDECGGRFALEDLTTTDVVKMFIKPFIIHKKSSYCEYLKTIDPSSVGEAQVFISHAWKYQFLDVVDTLKYHFMNTPNIYVWIDSFSINNFIDPDIDDYLWSMMSIIKQVKHTVLIFFPWNNTVQPLTSAWILYEIYCTTFRMSRSEDCKFEIAMRPTDKYTLMKIVADGTVKPILPSIDCRNSTTFNPLPKIRILYLIDTTVGYDKMDEVVSECIEDTWSTLLKNKDFDESSVTLECLHDLATLYSSMGKYNDALPFYEKYLSQREKLFGPIHPKTLQSINDLAVLYEKLKRYDDALVLYSKFLATTKDKLGTNHPSAIQLLDNFVNLSLITDEFNDALSVYVRCLAVKEKICGPNHPDTIQTMNSLAFLYERMGWYEYALNLHARLFALRRNIYGEKHEDTLQSMKNMTTVCISIGRDAEALYLFKNYIAILEEKSSNNHPQTVKAISDMDAFIDTLPLHTKMCLYDVVKSTVGINGMYSYAYNRLIEKITVAVKNAHRNNSSKEHYAMAMRSLGTIRMNQGYFEIAKRHFDESFSYSKELQVEKPVLMLLSMNDLAVLFSKMGKYNEALDLFSKCLVMWNELLEMNHLNTMISINTIEDLCGTSSVYKDVVRLYTACLGLREKGQTELEEKHPYILTLKSNFAHLKMRMGKYADALEMLTFCLGGWSELLGKDHPDTLATMISLAELYEIIGEHDKAKDLYEKNLLISYYLLEEKQPFTERVMTNLNNLLKNVLKYRNSLVLFTDCLSLREAMLGVMHDDTHESMNNLKELYQRIGGDDARILLHTNCFPLEEYEGKSESITSQLSTLISFSNIERNYRIVPSNAVINNSDEIVRKKQVILPCHGNNIIWLGITEEIMRMKDPDPLTMVNNLAYLYMKLGKYDQALPLFTNCLAMREEVLGKKHPDTLLSIRYLAELYKYMGRYYDALPLYQKYSSLLIKIFGYKHPYCLEIKNEIALLYNKIGEYDKAQSMNNEKLLHQNNPSRNNEDSHSRISDTQESCFKKLKYGFKYTLSASDEQSKNNSYVNAVCCTMKYVVSASDDMRILVWEVIEDRIVFQRELRGHTGPIACLYVLKDREIILNQILSASRDGTIKKWDLDKGLCVQSIKHDDNSINECLAVICSENYIFKAVRNRNMGTEKGIIHIFDIKLGGFLCELRGHTDYVRCFAVTSAYLFSGSLDKSIRRWDLNNITTMCSENFTEDKKCFPLLGHTDWVRSLCCAKDESRLISGSNDMTVRIWDIQTGVAIQILTVPNSRVRCLCMSDDGMKIICGAEDHTIRTWDLETGCPIRILRGHADWVTSVCGIPGSDKIVSCSSDFNVILWDVYSSPNLFNRSHECIGDKECPVLSLCQYNERLLMTCTKDVIYVWDPQQQYKKEFFRDFSDAMGAEISCICNNKSNKSVIICCNYRSRGRSTVIELFVNDPGNRIESRDYNGITKCICACANHIIIGFTHKNSILIKHFDNNCVNERICSLQSIPLTIDCVSVDSNASSIYIIIGSQNKDILIWKYDCCNITKCFALIGHTYPVRCLTHSIDSNDKYIISGSDDYDLKLWHLPAEDIRDQVVEVTPVNSFVGHTRPVTAVICTTGLIISGSADFTIMIWSFNGRNLLRTLIGHSSDITGLQISIAKHLVSTSKDGTMKVWDLSVGNNVPSDVELQELIRVRHNDYGYCAQVTGIIETMSTDNFGSGKNPILVDFIKNHKFLSMEDKSILLNEFNRLLEICTLNNFTKPMYYNMGGFLKSFQLRAKQDTMDLVPYCTEGDEYEMIPLVHWMSRQPHYRDYLLDNILPIHPELLYSRTKDGKTLFGKAVQNLVDPDFTNHSLQILSTNLQQRSLEMMWCDHYTVRKADAKATATDAGDTLFYRSPFPRNASLEKSYPLVDVEDIVQAMQILWRVDIINDGILSLQCAPDELSNYIMRYESQDMNQSLKNKSKKQKQWFWDGDSEEKYLVEGCNHLFQVTDLENICKRRASFRKFVGKIFSFFSEFVNSTEDRSEIKQVMYVPFPMGICERGRFANKQHTSSLLLEVCIEFAMKKDNASVFDSSALSAILTYKLKMYGWLAFFVQCILCITLAVHFGYYSIVHSSIDIPIWWPIVLFIHTIPVVTLEFLPNYLRTVFSVKYKGGLKFLYGGIFLSLVLVVVGGVLWFSYDQPGSEYDAILNLILFMIIFIRAVNNLKYLPTYGLFVRMLLQVLGRMWSYIFLLIIYFIGFATAFNILIPTVRRAYDDECSDNLDTDQCVDMKAATERFQHPVISWVTTYMTMMNAIGWESSAFNVSNAYSIYALIVLFCIFIFVSNVALNITISLMNYIYEMISQNEHASCHLVQAQYVLGIEILLLYFHIIDLNDEVLFPRWILVVRPKTHQSVEDSSICPIK